MSEDNIAEAILGAVSGWLDENGLELVGIKTGREPRGYYVRFFIDRLEGPMTIDDCVVASQALSPMLENVSGLDQKYFLEVSSPGLDRPLKKPADFSRFTGKMAKIRLHEKVDGMKALKGRISGAKDNIITVETELGERFIEWDNISKANLEVEF